MSTADSLTKAKRFHAIAQENLRLAEAAPNTEVSRHYARLAEHYLVMAKAELESTLSHPDPLR